MLHSWLLGVVFEAPQKYSSCRPLRPYPHPPPPAPCICPIVSPPLQLLPSDRKIPLNEDFTFYHASASGRAHDHMKDAALMAIVGKVSDSVVTAGGASFVSRGKVVAELVSRFAFHYRHMVAEDEVDVGTE